MKKNIWLILFWGSLWGIAEATIGYLLHRAAIAIPGLPGFMMFPVAFFFMRKVYVSTGEETSVSYISMVAASIKLIDFFIPGNMPIRIINPALSILMEGLAVSLVLNYCGERNLKLSFIHTFAMGLSWRGLFLIHLFIISLFNLPAALITDGIYYTLKFLIFESFINSILMYGYLQLDKAPKVFQVKPAYSWGALGAALAIQFIM